jgi:hypothetical protein
MAQDTGGAIKGAVRADFFWGFGKEAGAGRADEAEWPHVGSAASRAGAKIRRRRTGLGALCGFCTNIVLVGAICNALICNIFDALEWCLL